MEMAGIVHGGIEALADKPRVLTLINTLCPLAMDRIALDTLRVHARYRQPLAICSGLMSGTTAPVTLAGTMALGCAETLAGVAIAQILAEGMPVVMAINATPVDMRTGGVNIGSPAHALAVKYTAGLSRLYGIPCRCGGTGTDAGGVTIQSGYEGMMGLFVSLQEKVDLIIHAAGILDGYGAISLEKFVADREIIRMAEYYFADLAVNESALALDAIRQVGPGGQFLTHPHTMEHCRSEPFPHGIGVSGPPRDAATPEAAIMISITKKLDSALNAYRKPELPDETQARLDTYLSERGITHELLNTL